MYNSHRRSGTLFAITLLGLVVLRICLDASYRLVLCPFFAYLGYVYQPRAWFYLPVSWFLSLYPFLAGFVPIALKRASHLVLWILYITVYFPLSCFAAYWGPQALRITLLTVIIAHMLGVLRLPELLPRLRFGKLPARTCKYLLVLLVTTIIAAGDVMGLKIFGFTPTINIWQAYVLRRQFHEAATAGRRLFAYLGPWQGNVINPLLIVLGLDRSAPLLFALGIAGQVLLFSMGGWKSYLFSGLLVCALFITIDKFRSQWGTVFVWGLVLLVASCLLVDLLARSFVLDSLFVRRFIFVPGKLTVHYYDFFSENPKYYYSASFLHAFVENPYSLSPPHLIGSKYGLFKADTSANANIWADGIANLGWPGIILATGLLAFVLYVFDSVAANKDLRIIGPLLAMPSFALANSALFTCLLTHGVALAWLITYLLQPSHDDNPCLVKEQT